MSTTTTITTTPELVFPTLTKLEKLLLTDVDKMNHEIVDKITREPRPPDNYSVVDNIYRCLAPSANNLLLALSTLHRELLNDEYNRLSSLNSSNSFVNLSGLIGLHSLPRELLPHIADYGHSEYFWERITPKHPRYAPHSKIGKVVERYVEDGNDQQKLIRHGSQVITYFEDSGPHVIRRLFLYGKPILEESFSVPHESRPGQEQKVFVPRVYSIRFLDAANKDRGYIGYGFGNRSGDTALMRFRGLTFDKESFSIVPPAAAENFSSASFPTCHLDLLPLNPDVYSKDKLLK